MFSKVFKIINGTPCTSNFLSKEVLAAVCQLWWNWVEVPSHVYLLLLWKTWIKQKKSPSEFKWLWKQCRRHLQIPQANFDFSREPLKSCHHSRKIHSWKESLEISYLALLILQTLYKADWNILSVLHQYFLVLHFWQ